MIYLQRVQIRELLPFTGGAFLQSLCDIASLFCLSPPDHIYGNV